MLLISVFLLGLFFTGLAGVCSGEDNPAALTIAEGLKLATDNNRLIRIAALERDMSHADTLVARSRYFPTVTASLSQTFLAYQPGAVFGPASVPTAERRSLAYGVDVYQLLYDFGGRTSRYKASETALDESRLNIARIRNLVALDFITGYCDLLETEKRKLVAQREVERLESHLKTARSLFEEGVITKNDLLQAEVRLSDAKQRLLTVRNARAVSAGRLNNILSRPLREEIRTVDIQAGAVLSE
ncbi:MAG TPA: TolC family protein, partial [Dissulfurispiraceae bacterium]